MRILVSVFTLAAVAATTGLAAEMSDLDSDENGVLSVEEFTAAFPDADPSIFVSVDVNEDGVIDPAEFLTATSAGGALTSG